MSTEIQAPQRLENAMGGVCKMSMLIGLARLNTTLLMREKRTRQMYMHGYKKFQANESLQNEWMMAQVEIKRQLALHLRPLIVIIDYLGSVCGC